MSSPTVFYKMSGKILFYLETTFLGAGLHNVWFFWRQERTWTEYRDCKQLCEAQRLRVIVKFVNYNILTLVKFLLRRQKIPSISLILQHFKFLTFTNWFQALLRLNDIWIIFGTYLFSSNYNIYININVAFKMYNLLNHYLNFNI